MRKFIEKVTTSLNIKREHNKGQIREKVEEAYYFKESSSDCRHSNQRQYLNDNRMDSQGKGQGEYEDGANEEYEILEREILPQKIICPDCGGLTLEGLEFCDKCGGELTNFDER